MFTRKDYVHDRKCSHREYYAQFVNDNTKQYVSRVIGVDKILNSTDEHFNDIALRNWDCLTGLPLNSIYEQVGDYHTLGNQVCIAKEAARQIKEERGVINDTSN